MKRLFLVAAMVLAAATAGAQEIGAGFGYFGFVGDNGALRDLKGLAGQLRLEVPLDTYSLPGDVEVESWDESIIIGAPIVSDLDEVLALTTLEYAHRVGKADAFIMGGLAVGVLGEGITAPLLEDMEGVIPGKAVYVGGRLGAWFAVPVGDATFPVELGVVMAGEVAGLPDDADHPLLVGFTITAPRDLLPGG